MAKPPGIESFPSKRDDPREASVPVVSRHYELFRSVVPVEDYAKMKQYFSSVAKADRSAAILRSGVAANP